MGFFYFAYPLWPPDEPLGVRVPQVENRWYSVYIFTRNETKILLPRPARLSTPKKVFLFEPNLWFFLGFFQVSSPRGSTWFWTTENMFFLGGFLFVGIWSCFHFIPMKLDFISQPSSKSTLLLAGLQQMQQWQVNFHLIFASMLWSKWMVHEKWSPQWGVWTYDLSVMSLLP